MSPDPEQIDLEDMIDDVEKTKAVKLVSMLDYVTTKEVRELWPDDFVWHVYKYAEFLKQPLELWMFVPCGEDGETLDQPEIGREKLHDASDTSIESIVYHKGWHDRLSDYKKAEDRLLLEGLNKDSLSMLHDAIGENGTIDDWIYYKGEYGLTLTPNAIKQLGL